jgi:hypothetical protein
LRVWGLVAWRAEKLDVQGEKSEGHAIRVGGKVSVILSESGAGSRSRCQGRGQGHGHAIRVRSKVRVTLSRSGSRCPSQGQGQGHAVRVRGKVTVILSGSGARHPPPPPSSPLPFPPFPPLPSPSLPSLPPFLPTPIDRSLRQPNPSLPAASLPPRSLARSLLAGAQIFIMELAFNMFGHWFWPFVREVWNWLDTFIVLCSLVAVLDPAVPGLNFLRIFRAFRLIRLIRRSSSTSRVPEGGERELVRGCGLAVVVVVVGGGGAGGGGNTLHSLALGCRV